MKWKDSVTCETCDAAQVAIRPLSGAQTRSAQSPWYTESADVASIAAGPLALPRHLPVYCNAINSNLLAEGSRILLEIGLVTGIVITYSGIALLSYRIITTRATIATEAVVYTNGSSQCETRACVQLTDNLFILFAHSWPREIRDRGKRVHAIGRHGVGPSPDISSLQQHLISGEYLSIIRIYFYPNDLECGVTMVLGGTAGLLEHAVERDAILSA
jgi:hypothetical protein